MLRPRPSHAVNLRSAHTRPPSHSASMGAPGSADRCHQPDNGFTPPILPALLRPSSPAPPFQVTGATDLTMAHIHQGNASTSGPVIVPLVPVGMPIAATATSLPMLTQPASGDGEPLPVPVAGGRWFEVQAPAQADAGLCRRLPAARLPALSVIRGPPALHAWSDSPPCLPATCRRAASQH